jgi:hypothetical protein
MKKNPNKTAGNWGALKNKPQNLVPFKSGGKVTVSAGGEKHVIYKKTTKRGEGKVGNVMVNHPTKDKGVWDTIDLTKKSGAKTIQQGVASTKKWHKENPYNDMKKKLTKKQMGGPSQKTRSVTKSPSGDYRTVDKTKYSPAKIKESSKTRRTLKGVVNNAPKPNRMGPLNVAPMMPPSDGQYMQKGGSVKKYQTGGTADSTDYFKADKNLYYKQAETNAKYGLRKEAAEMMKKAGKAAQDELRQKNKGKLGYDANGRPADIQQQELLRRAKKISMSILSEVK